MFKISLVLLMTLHSLPVFSNSIIDLKQSLRSASLEEIFESGLKGVGECRILPTFVFGYPSLKVVGKTASNVVGEGVVRYRLPNSSLTFAHGLVYSPHLATKFSDPELVFPDSDYEQFKTNDFIKNAALMLIFAIQKDRCGLKSSSKTLNNEMISGDIKKTFSFYHSENKGPAYVSNPENAIKKSLSSHPTAVKKIEILNLKEVQESQFASLSSMTLAKAQLAQRKPDIFAIIPLDNFLIDPQKILTSEKEQLAAIKLKLYFESLVLEHMRLVNFTEDFKEHVNKIFERLGKINKNKYDKLLEVASREMQKNPPVNPRALRLTLESYFSPVKKIYPKLEMDAIECN